MGVLRFAPGLKSMCRLVPYWRCELFYSLNGTLPHLGISTNVERNPFRDSNFEWNGLLNRNVLLLFLLISSADEPLYSLDCAC